MYHHTETPRDITNDFQEVSKEEASVPNTKDKVFSKLFQDEQNQFCFDCGWSNPTHVSINNGVFLCSNCATGIHLEHYPVEVSCIKSITDPDSFNYQQLRVLINGGNQNAFEFFEIYDLHNEPV